MQAADVYEEIEELRRSLHRKPDLSGDEAATAGMLVSFLGSHPNRRIVTGIGGHGILLIYDSGKPGKTILLRADIDALPIPEENTAIPYASQYPGKAHLCGHDGHSAILAGVARRLDEEGLSSGKVLLLFQPSEENGQGAHAVLNDPKFTEMPDMVFALHNLPGFPMHRVVLREGPFAYASTGMIIRLGGRTSHAAEPEKGISPERAIQRIIAEVSAYRDSLPEDVIATTTHIRLGEKAFGISPGQAEVCFTVRAPETAVMEKVCGEIGKRVQVIAREEKLTYASEMTEFFPSTENDPFATDIVNEAVQRAGLKAEDLDLPFRWSEDFGWFTGRFPGALFGLGSGTEQKPLHDPAYDFPDALLPSGIQLFMEIIRICQERL